MIPAQEPLDVIIIPYAPCPCGEHDTPSELFIYRTVPLGVFKKAEVHCLQTDKVFDAAFMFFAPD